MNARPLSDADVERVLRSVSEPPQPGRRGGEADEDLRISIAGVQEKTALLSMGGAWFCALGATPTTHILKLPLGVIDNFRGNFSESVENEWLCAQYLRDFGLLVADTQMATFGGQKALAVTRFDRRWVGAAEHAVSLRGFTPAQGVWIARLPQEDFCQATARSPLARYETDGGPSMDEILGILANCENPERDCTNFVLAQLAFWLFAATDGHAKNFSIRHRAGGAFALTPPYDVISAWPEIGRGATQLQIQDARLAMALRGRTRHYRIGEIQARHWHAPAQRTGVSGLWARMRAFVESTDTVIDRMEASLPDTFPERVITKIAGGIRRQARSFLRAAPENQELAQRAFGTPGVRRQLPERQDRMGRSDHRIDPHAFGNAQTPGNYAAQDLRDAAIVIRCPSGRYLLRSFAMHISRPDLYRKTVVSASSAILLFAAAPMALAAEKPAVRDHTHGAASSTPKPEGTQTADMMQQMQAMHASLMAAKTPDERAALMPQQMEMMQSGMTMMQSMNGMRGKSAQSSSARRMDMMEMMMQMMMDRMSMPTQEAPKPDAPK